MIKYELRNVKLTVTNTQTGEVSVKTVGFNYFLNAVNLDPMYQLFNMSCYSMVKVCVDLGIISNSELTSIEESNGVGVVRVVRSGVPYNDEQRFTHEQCDIRAFIHIEML